jgi:hypothetical protein
VRVPLALDPHQDPHPEDLDVQLEEVVRVPHPDPKTVPLLVRRVRSINAWNENTTATLAPLEPINTR